MNSWARDLTQHQLSHKSIWDFMTRGLTLLGNLCDVSALLKEMPEALHQVS